MAVEIISKLPVLSTCEIWTDLIRFNGEWIQWISFSSTDKTSKFRESDRLFSYSSATSYTVSDWRRLMDARIDFSHFSYSVEIDWNVNERKNVGFTFWIIPIENLPFQVERTFVNIVKSCKNYPPIRKTVIPSYSSSFTCFDSLHRFRK